MLYYVLHLQQYSHRLNSYFYEFIIAAMCATFSAHLILLDFIVLLCLVKSTNYEASQLAIFLLDPQFNRLMSHAVSTLFSTSLHFCSSFKLHTQYKQL